MSPQRIQRSRQRGWRMPEGAVAVSRPSKWGNPYRIGGPYELARPGLTAYGVVRDHAHAVELFTVYVNGRPGLRAGIRRELRGRDLACWCPLLDKDDNRVPCHADVLLAVANEVTA